MSYVMRLGNELARGICETHWEFGKNPAEFSINPGAVGYLRYNLKAAGFESGLDCDYDSFKTFLNSLPDIKNESFPGFFNFKFFVTMARYLDPSLPYCVSTRRAAKVIWRWYHSNECDTYLLVDLYCNALAGYNFSLD